MEKGGGGGEVVRGWWGGESKQEGNTVSKTVMLKRHEDNCQFNDNYSPREIKTNKKNI